MNPGSLGHTPPPPPVSSNVPVVDIQAEHPSQARLRPPGNDGDLSDF